MINDDSLEIGDVTIILLLQWMCYIYTWSFSRWLGKWGEVLDCNDPDPLYNDSDWNLFSAFNVVSTFLYSSYLHRSLICSCYHNSSISASCSQKSGERGERRSIGKIVWSWERATAGGEWWESTWLSTLCRAFLKPKRLDSSLWTTALSPQKSLEGEHLPDFFEGEMVAG